jgi:hypothetical protein
MPIIFVVYDVDQRREMERRGEEKKGEDCTFLSFWKSGFGVWDFL